MTLPKNRGNKIKFGYFHDNVAYADEAGNATPVGQFVGGQYNASAPTYSDGDPCVMQFDVNGRLKTDASMTVTGDIQLGAVELKNGTDDTRATIKSDGTDNALVVTSNPLGSAPQAYGMADTGTNSYATVVTASATRYHMMVSLQGSNNAIVSLDSGTTESFYIPANSSHIFDEIKIESGATVQAKNAITGKNFDKLTITIW